jgi:hypothetical protein
MALQQITDILNAPVILAGVISPGASIPKALPQVTDEKEEKGGKGNAGGPVEGNHGVGLLFRSFREQQ